MGLQWGMRSSPPLVFSVLLLLVAGCGQEPGADAGSTPEPTDGGGAPDEDAGDTDVDAGLDAGSDAGWDGGADAGWDGGSDAGWDGGADAGWDGGADAGWDAGWDAGPPVCNEQDAEPNDARGDAVDLGFITDDDDDGASRMGTLAGTSDVDWYRFNGTESDVDWYRFNGTDEYVLIVDPTAGLSAAVTLRLCMYVTCEVGATLLTCPTGTTAEIGAEGLEGCCWNRVDAALLSVDVECEGTDDDALVEMRVDQAPLNTCLNYSLSYHY